MVTQPLTPVCIASDAVIALVAADPFSTDRDRLQEEAEAIRESAGPKRRQWHVKTLFHEERDSLAAMIAELRPDIVQFTGHGSASGQLLLGSRTGLVTHITDLPPGS